VRQSASSLVCTKFKVIRRAQIKFDLRLRFHVKVARGVVQPLENP